MASPKLKMEFADSVARDYPILLQQFWTSHMIQERVKTANMAERPGHQLPTISTGLTPNRKRRRGET